MEICPTLSFHRKIAQHNKHIWHRDYPGNPNGKTSIPWILIRAQEIFTKGELYTLNKDFVYSYSMVAFCRLLGSENLHSSWTCSQSPSSSNLKADFVLHPSATAISSSHTAFFPSLTGCLCNKQAFTFIMLPRKAKHSFHLLEAFGLLSSSWLLISNIAKDPFLTNFRVNISDPFQINKCTTHQLRVSITNTRAYIGFLDFDGFLGLMGF